MTADPDTERLWSDLAEALVLLDPEDAGSFTELVERLEALRAILGCADDAARLLTDTIATVRRAAEGDTDSMAEIEGCFAVLRSMAPTTAGTTGKAVLSAQAPTPATAPAAESRSAPGTTMPLAGDDELLRDFAIRAGEHLDDAEERALALEADPNDTESIDAVFRAFHTIKGMAGFLALDPVSEHAHASESLLADVRKAGAGLTEANVAALFPAIDGMRALVADATGIAGDAPSAAEVTPGAHAGPTATLGEHAPEQVALRAGSVRVDAARLDALLDAIGELVIAETMASASVRTGAGAMMLETQVERLDKITRELQQMATSLRMVPLRSTFRRMARLVRDVASRAGKHVDFVMSGEETELDKVVVDRISDPLVHALRNAVDHGIESPEERRAAGKPETGRVELRAYHAGGAIHVEIADDGRGIDTGRVLETARRRGFVGEKESPDARACLDLLFEPGFSTAEKVTDVSGRGVGMDVVRTTTEELRGRVGIHSVDGEGMTLSLRLPLTLAIIDGMVLRVGDERYVLPLLSIERSVRPADGDITLVAGRGEMLVTDDCLVPLLRLHRVFGVAGAQIDPTQGVVVIVDEGGLRAGLLACELLGQQQTVIKPLGDGLPEQAGITGGAIMPDGHVGLILDAAGLVRTANSADVERNGR